MSTYRVEWDCCGSVTETDALEPEHCPFCTPDPEVASLHALNAELVEALQNYMAAFGQGLDAHGIPHGPQQREADEQARASIKKATEVA